MRKRIKEICHHGVHSIPQDASVKTALELMKERGISCVVVLNDQHPVGIFTERDVVRHIATTGQKFTGKTIREVMTDKVVTTTPDTFVFEAFNILAERRIRHLVVVDDTGAAIGMTTQTDIVDHFGYDYFIKVQVVEQIMMKSICTVGEDANLREAVRLMNDRRVSFLVVAQDNIPAGVLTERDVTRLVVDGKDLDEIMVGSVMSSPVLTITENAPAFTAGELMRKNQIRRLVVVDEQGGCIGVLTQTDMVRGLESKYIEMLKQIINEQGRELDKTVQMLANKTLYMDCILSSSINMGIIGSDDRLVITYFNPAAEKILGMPASHFIGRNIWDIHSAMNVAPGRLNKALSAVEGVNAHEFSFVLPTGPDNAEPRHISARMSAISNAGRIIGYVLMMEDVTEEIKAREMITRLAYHDVLTDLPNRALFNERLASEMARGRRHGASFGLILMDVDGFKMVNDTYGHHVGDLLLQTIARRLDGVVRESDMVARIGGDEFCFILTDLNEPRGNAVDIAVKLLERLSPPVPHDGYELRVNYSMGISLYPEHGDCAETLITKADKAMYQSKMMGKRSGESHITIYNPSSEA